MLPKHEQKDTLAGFDERIQVMERRLRNARNARDSYVNYLRGKYPDWHGSTRGQPNEPLVNRLATSDYQWDVDRKPVHIPQLPLNHKIDLPTNGPLLESDLRNVKKRLQEISEQLKTIRGTRMSMSTEQFMGIQAFTGISDDGPVTRELNISSISGAEEKSFDRMDEIRRRLREVRVARTSSPVYTPTEEKKFELEMLDERERVVEEIRAQQPIRHNVVRFSEPVEPEKEIVMEEVKQEQKKVAEVTFTPARASAPVVEEVKSTPKPEPQPSTSSFSQMMNLLNQQNADSSSDSDDPVPIRKTSISTPAVSLLSQYLNKPGSDSSSEDEKPLPKPSLNAPKLSAASKMYASNDSSEDDFFN